MCDTQKSLEDKRKEAIDNERCFSKGRLRDEFRMKPAPGTEPVAYYPNGFGGEFGVYKISDCVPLRTINKTAPSPKQIRGRKISSLKAKLRSALAKASLTAGAWLDARPVILDSETTGLGNNAQIIEISIIDSSGEVLLDTRVKATVPVEDEARSIHGISDESLSAAAQWPEIVDQVKKLLQNRVVVIFNSEFDIRLMRQSGNAFKLNNDWIDGIDTRCAMDLSADAYGATNRYGTISLADAAVEAGVVWEGSAHSSLADSKATLGIIKTIAKYSADLERQVRELTYA